MIAALLVAWLVASTDASTVNGVGYEVSIPPVQTTPPYMPTPYDTTPIVVPSQREARLACQESVPLYRTATCDITTWDDCGNLYGDGTNISDWVVTVTNQVTGSVSLHVSPIISLKLGVARFYFTALELGVYSVSVVRSVSSTLPSLRTNTPMVVLVVVSNSISRCTTQTVLAMQAQLSTTSWAASSFSNEYRTIPGLSGLSKPTSVVVDTAWIYPTPDDVVQTRIRRAPLAPKVLTKLQSQLPADGNNFKYCDVIQQS
jgi:hypothetical protein